MKKRKSKGKPAPCEVIWITQEDPKAEDEFWRLYLRLVLEQMTDVIVPLRASNQEKDAARR